MATLPYDTDWLLFRVRRQLLLWISVGMDHVLTSSKDKILNMMKPNVIAIYLYIYIYIYEPRIYPKVLLLAQSLHTKPPSDVCTSAVSAMYNDLVVGKRVRSDQTNDYQHI